MKKLIRLSENDIHNIVKEAVRRAINENMDNGLWAEIRFVQGGEDYDKIMDMFCGEENRETAYCAGYSQPVIDYLKQWDGDENNLVTEKPRIASGDTSYEDENGEYTLLYNGSIGGCFLLYRPANEQEIDWYNNRRNPNESILREGLNNQPDYTHYAVNKATNKIVYSWAYGGIEGSELRQFKKDYFIIDLTDNDLDPKQYKILGKAALMRQGIDPDDDSNWANS